MKKRRTLLEKQRSLTFGFHQALGQVIEDLKKIDSLIPAESSRISRPETQDEAAAIIQSRKRKLLNYIQVICRDHIYYAKKFLDDSKVTWIAK